MSRRDLEMIERAIAELDVVEREVFLAHRIDELSLDRIAAVTGQSVQEVERRLATAMIAIDRELCRRD